MGEKQPRRFKHLSPNDRLKMEQMIKEGRKQCEIAKALHTSESTISREKKRGRYTHMNTDLTTEDRYSPDKAEARYRANLAAKGPELKIGNDREYADYLEERILAGDSPDEILGDIKKKGLQFNTTICTNTFYSYLEKGVFLKASSRNLPVKGKKKRPQKHKKAASRASRGESIEKRPPEVNTREVAGHWEQDCVEGEKGTPKTLLVLTERKTRNQIIRLMPSKTMESVIAALDDIEREYGAMFPVIFKSITVDNGSEFSDCEGMERSVLDPTKRRTKFYYCHPYSSYERGSNENQNRLIRRKFPKGFNFENTTAEEVQAAEDWLNGYARRMFGYESAAERFAAEFPALFSTAAAPAPSMPAAPH